MQNNKLFVGNVAYATALQTLVDLFSQHGEVIDSYKPDQKGFAFITFKTAEQADAAMKALNGHDNGNGYEVDGRIIKISIAEPKGERPSNRFGNNDRRGGFGGGRGNGGRSGGRRDRY